MMTHGVVALHGLVAVMSQTPEMEVNQSEGEMLSKAIVPLMAHYHITPPPEMVLWGNLFVALAYVEGPRFALIRMRKATERAERARRVYDSPNAAPTGPAPGSEMPFGYGTGAAPGSGQPN